MQESMKTRLDKIFEYIYEQYDGENKDAVMRGVSLACETFEMQEKNLEDNQYVQKNYQMAKYAMVAFVALLIGLRICKLLS